MGATLMDGNAALLKIPAPDRLEVPPPVFSGKVREVFDFGEELLFVASDRLSAFDVIFPTPIAGKGRVLTSLSVFWFERLSSIARNHLIAEPDIEWLSRYWSDPAPMLGRSLRVKKCEPFPVECVVRGRLEGSGWKEYQTRQAIQEHPLPPGLRLHDALPEPIFTPATKATSGHDENISFAEMIEIVGIENAEKLRRLSLEIFLTASRLLEPLGVILADTKFEFGLHDGEITLIDEVLTPDSSRFLRFDKGKGWTSFDKQFLRDWAEETGWDKKPPAPEIPGDIAHQTALRYQEISELIQKGIAPS